MGVPAVWLTNFRLFWTVIVFEPTVVSSARATPAESNRLAPNSATASVRDFIMTVLPSKFDRRHKRRPAAKHGQCHLLPNPPALKSARNVPGSLLDVRSLNHRNVTR